MFHSTSKGGHHIIWLILHHTMILELSEALCMNQDLLETKIIVHAVRIINNDSRVRVN